MFLDMLAALKWVRKNIASFKGDPRKVTIFGESGGGAKVSAVVAFPMADGFTQGAIYESGAGIQEQSPNERRQDVLRYTTPELKEDLEVTGPLKLHIFAATSAKDTDFVAKLVDVYPDGRAYNVTDSTVRTRYRKSLFQAELVTPGEVDEYMINLEATSQLFRRGHRIRIAISSSSFPECDRNMNTGNLVGEDAQGITARQTVYHDSRFASYIDLPVIPNT